jgi:NAD(P)H-hydrate epimerase
VLTPHPGEAARLIGRDVKTAGDRIAALRRFGSVVVLKGSVSAIDAGGPELLNAFGTSGMAKGGSGDVLTGVIGALLAQGYSAPDAAAFGSALHGLAGEGAARRHAPEYMGPEELIEGLDGVFLELQNERD